MFLPIETEYSFLVKVENYAKMLSRDAIRKCIGERDTFGIPGNRLCPIVARTQLKTGFKTTNTRNPKKYAHGFCFAVLFCGYTLTDFPISIRLTSLALWQSNDCPSASKATLMNMDKYFMWIHYERLHNHNKAKHDKTVCIFLGIYCKWYCMVNHHKIPISRAPFY